MPLDVSPEVTKIVSLVINCEKHTKSIPLKLFVQKKYQGDLTHLVDFPSLLAREAT